MGRRTTTGSGSTSANAGRRRAAGRSWRRRRSVERRSERLVTIDPRAASHAGALQALLGDAVDYAGLFPPAQLDMAGAVAEYASYLASPDRWALGRFVVPAARVPELVAEGESLAAGSRASLGTPQTGWALSVLLGTDVMGDVEMVRAFVAAQAARPGKWAVRVDAVEARASSPDGIDAIAKAVGDSFTSFVEI